MIWLLLIVYQIKHWVADYPLQGKFMLGKFLPWPKYILPLTAHAAVHGVMTFVIAMFFKPEIALALGVFDFATHFIVDRLKASPDIGGRFKAMSKDEYVSYQERIKILSTWSVPPISGEVMEARKILESEFAAKMKSNVYFWWALGADQMAHHLTHYFIIWQLVR